MPDKQSIRLSKKEREMLREIIATGQRPARVIRRAHILLRSAEGWTDEAIAGTFATSVDTVRRTRLGCLARGVLACLADQPRAGAPHKLDEEEEARLVALACSDPPRGHGRWTIRLLAEHAIGRELIRPVAPETVRQVLQKTK
ncbi:MAG: helix-turn-helix domain-containing protein [Candidatus Roseilinea sp.]|uniref:helix-turn-helix domain-containing protein n=1 Tax=Candidatus Roseilinea sp. TaxID=2838777 RepID=UPI00404A52BB